MICPKCNSKMRCVNTYTEVIKVPRVGKSPINRPRTARHYKCDCGGEMYTMEERYNTIEVVCTLAKRQLNRKEK